MPTNSIIQALDAAFKLEIANQFILTDNTLTVTLPDQKQIVINAQCIKTDANNKPQHLTLPIDTHSYEYVHQHDFSSNEQQPLQRLLLRNIEDCRAYVDDVCQNLLDVPVHDFEVQFSDGTTYLITIEPKK